VTRHLGASRRALFDEIERAALKTLPVEPYIYAEWKECKVGFDYHVEVERQYYSVPHALLRETVREQGKVHRAFPTSTSTFFEWRSSPSKRDTASGVDGRWPDLQGLDGNLLGSTRGEIPLGDPLHRYN
jgi:hypothetical protein